jgi:DNA-binding HxlR family transcriptional regulator
VAPLIERSVLDDAGDCGCSEPESKAAATCYCTVDQLVRAIARKHALSLLNVIGRFGRARFRDLEASLPRVSTSTLSETLGVLGDVGLVRRDVFPDTPPRVEYSLTEAGNLLRNRLHMLLEQVLERD